MNDSGIMLNIICFGFLLLLLILYFTKQNMNNVENKVYKCLLVDDFVLILTELGFLFSCYYIPKNLFLIGLLKRFNFFCILIFFVLIFTYVMIICVENNEKVRGFFIKHKRNTFKVVLFMVFVIAIFQFSLPIEYFYNKQGIILYAYGPCTNDFATVVTAILVLILLPFIIGNWKSVNKKKLSPFLVVTFLEVMALVIVNIIPSLCTASFSITMTCYLMFFTIENPDLKMIAELSLAKDSAEKANNAKSDFLSSMSHEIRTPLNAIVGLSQMIKSSSDVEDIHNDTDDIIMASQNLLELVEGILDINKLEANKMDIVDGEYNPREVFDSLVKMMKIRLGTKPLEFRYNYNDQLPEKLFGDKDKIKQITSNLISNAIKYTEEGSVDFNVDCEIKDDDCLLKIIVTDTGRGIRDDQKEYLFTKFYRLEEDKDSDIQGTGLGLAITKAIVDLMGGKISVDSRYGEGSTFTIEVKQKILAHASNTEEVEEVPENVVEEAPKEVVQQAKEETTPVENKPAVEEKTTVDDPNRPKVLMVVDDNKLNLRVATKLLDEYNFEVETANSGEECLQKVNSDDKYTLIFMDIMMPNMNGVETMHKLKEQESLKAPVVALTADAMEGSREKYLGEGFDDYISKPINREILEETLSKYITDVDKYKK